MKRGLNKIIVGVFIVAISVAFCLSVSFPLFTNDYSTVLYSNDGSLLGARVADDYQWRFPSGDSIPQKYCIALVAYEDRYFYNHLGVNPFAIIRAIGQNISAKEVVSGGSTITMQLMRLSKGRDRTVASKIIEAIQAVRVELTHSKAEILSLYAAHAPFGGNIVGIEAASWRYFNRSPHSLSWAESAMLAVLPNSPGLIHTGKNRERLKEKRDRLLHTLLAREQIDSLTYNLSIHEPIPEHPHPMSQVAPHLLSQYMKSGKGKNYHSTIDIELQQRVNSIVAAHHNELSRNGVNNAAVIVVNVDSNDVLAYCGNTPAVNGEDNGNSVDIITSPRSTASVLKPLLYAAAIQDGLILPKQLLADIPTYYKNFSPKNYNRKFNGAVPADEALSRSLNVPAVRMLQEYDVARFHSLLQKAGFTTITEEPEHYGLSLILGGAESTLYDIAGAYSSMMRTLKSYTENRNGYFTNEFHRPITLVKDSIDRGYIQPHYPLFSAGALYSMFEAMCSVVRPEEEQGWENFSSTKKIAWKTGTSFGFRDAWAVGVTPSHVVAVWVGNADGEGCSRIVGGTAAAPIMFDIFRSLPFAEWVEVPYADMYFERICTVSGHRAGEYCPADTVAVPKSIKKGNICPYHHLVHLNREQTHRVTSEEYPIANMTHESWFTLPPTMEMYYSKSNPLYQKLPPYYNTNGENSNEIEFIYPQNNNKIFLPKGIDESTQPVVIKVAHHNPMATIYWHIDNRYLGSTTTMHNMEIVMGSGKHHITLIDNNGNITSKWIECVDNKDTMIDNKNK